MRCDLEIVSEGYRCRRCGRVVTSHYPPELMRLVCHAREDQATVAATAASGGKPGSELKLLLDWFRLETVGSCQCAARAAAMDQRGNEWCEANIDTIVGWLMESWDKNQMTLADFLPAPARRHLARLLRWLPERQIAAHGARWAVRTAIKRARNTEGCQSKSSAVPVANRKRRRPRKST